MLTSLLNLLVIYADGGKDSRSHRERRGIGNHQGHHQQKREADVRKTRRGKDEAAKQ